MGAANNCMLNTDKLIIMLDYYLFWQICSTHKYKFCDWLGGEGGGGERLFLRSLHVLIGWCKTKTALTSNIVVAQQCQLSHELQTVLFMINVTLSFEIYRLCFGSPSLFRWLLDKWDTVHKDQRRDYIVLALRSLNHDSV